MPASAVRQPRTPWAARAERLSSIPSAVNAELGSAIYKLFIRIRYIQNREWQRNMLLILVLASTKSFMQTSGMLASRRAEMVASQDLLA